MTALKKASKKTLNIEKEVKMGMLRATLLQLKSRKKSKMMQIKCATYRFAAR